MPCISNSGVVVLTRCIFNPIRASHSRVISSLWARITREISPKETGISRQIERLRLNGDAALVCTSIKSRRRVRGSYSSSFRTFASTSDGSEGSNGSFETGKNAAEEVSKILEGGFLAGAAEAVEGKWTKPEICTADELHYVSVPSTNWRLALWRYLPSPNAPKRSHPVLMLSGIGTNAIGFDLDPSVSMARYVADAGFDTWILEVRGAGLSKFEEDFATGVEESESDGALVESIDPEMDGTVCPPRKTPDETISSDHKFVQRPGEEKQDKAERRNGASDENNRAVEDCKVDPSTKALSLPENNETAVTNPEGGTELYSIAAGGISGEAWKTATRLSNILLDLSKKLSKLLTRGQSKNLSARFIDSVSGLFEDSTLSKNIVGLRERLTSLLQAQDSSTVVSQIADLRKKLAQLLEDGQDAVTPTVTDLQERLNSTVDDFQKFVDLIAKYDWDFDNYLEEDVPAAMEYIRDQSMPIDGKILGIGHSMGGIVLYALLSTRGSKSGLAGAVALASALDYQCSDTSLKMLLPLTDPAQVLNVPVVPLGALMTAIHPLVTRPPYALAWLGYQVSAQNMMRKELFSKLVLNNFGIIPVKLLLHLISAFEPGGLANRDRTVKYKENIDKVTIPVLAIAADRDLICPPVAVLDTVDLFKKDTITYKCVGDENRHYGHYDIVCSPGAKEEVFPVVKDFLVQYDEVKKNDKLKVPIEM